MFAGLENPVHLIFIAVIALLVFGPKQLPKMARSAGKHVGEAKEGIATFKQEFDHGLGEDNPLSEVVDTVRSAHPREIVKNAVKTPSEKKPPTGS